MKIGLQATDPVITGMGVVSSVGIGLDEFWAGCVSGKSGTGPITLCDATNLPVKVAGEVKAFDPSLVMSQKEIRRTSRFIQLGYAAVAEALQRADLNLQATDPTRVGIILGNAGGSIVTLVDELSVFETKGLPYCDPLVLPKSFPYMAATVVALKLGIRGYTSTCVTACSASTEAIAIGSDLVRRGIVDVLIAGGTEAWLSELPLMAFGLLRVFSTAEVPPEEASKPFDVERDGFVPGEGAAALVIESLDHAEKRGAAPLAKIAGFGVTNDAHHFTAPNPQGRDASRAMTIALANSGLQPSDISYVSAHATATQLSDIAESRALISALGQHAYRTPVSALKSMTGHCLGASGALEVVASVMSINAGMIPPTINLRNPDPACTLDYVPNEARQSDVSAVLKNSFAMGGHNVTLVICSI